MNWGIRLFGPAAILLFSTTLSTVAEARDIAGQWRGTGYAQVADGKRERVQCRVAYGRVSSKVFSVHAVCASPSVRILQRGTVLRATSNIYRGSLRNPDFNVTARVRIVVRGARQTVTIRAAEGSGRLTLRRR